MKLNRWLIAVVALAPLASWTRVASADPVIDYRTYRANAATILAGQGTNDPIVGDLTTTASASFVMGYLTAPAVLGTNAGDTITLTFGVSFNDGAGMVNAGDNFRFALFDFNGEVQDSATGGAAGGPNYASAGNDNTDQFRGYWLGARNGSGAGSAGSIRERISDLVTGDNAFAATGDNNATAPSLGSVGGDPVTLVSDVNGDGAGADYTGELKLTRNALGLVDVSGFFIGSNAATGNVFMQPDTTANASSTYGAIGFLIGGPLNVDQTTFTDIDVSVGGAGEPIPGDFNNDTKVDGVDFGIWKGDFGTSKDGEDFLDWQKNFGTGVPAAALAGSVPEPGTAALLALGLGGLVRRGRRRAADIA